jgi:signal peptidase
MKFVTLYLSARGSEMRIASILKKSKRVSGRIAAAIWAVVVSIAALIKRVLKALTHVLVWSAAVIWAVVVSIATFIGRTSKELRNVLVWSSKEMGAAAPPMAAFSKGPLGKSTKVLGLIAIAIIALMLLFGLFILIAPNSGWDSEIVLSGSMEPALKTGGVIVTRPVELDDIGIGDIILFERGEELIAHRVIDVWREDDGFGHPWFETKGDANEDPDPGLVSSDGETMNSVVFHVPYMGYFASFLKNRLAFLVLFGVPGLILVAMYGGDIRKGIAEVKAKRKAEAAAAAEGGQDEKE